MGDVFSAPGASQIRSMYPDRALIWYDYAEAWLHFPLGKVLDYGCGNGSFLERLVSRADECWGVDIDSEKVAAAQHLAPGCVRCITPDEALPFPDATFDTVAILEVIEHVSDERRVLAELGRVLKPGGRLLLTTPHRGLLTFMDPGNFKFVAPGFHRFIQCTVLRRRAYYEERFGRARRSEAGMVADFTVDQKPWHRHYRYRQIRALVPVELDTVGWAAYFPAFRAIWSFGLVLKVMTGGWVKNLPPPLEWMNKRLSRWQTTLGDQLVILFQKCA